MQPDYVKPTSYSTVSNLSFSLLRHQLNLVGDPDPLPSFQTARSLRAHSTHQNRLRHSQVSSYISVRYPTAYSL
jgi:hypothetical protein